MSTFKTIVSLLSFLIFLSACEEQNSTSTKKQSAPKTSGTTDSGGDYDPNDPCLVPIYCNGGDSSTSVPPPGPYAPATFEEVRQIVNASCGNCHNLPQNEVGYTSYFNLGGGVGEVRLIDPNGQVYYSPLYMTLNGVPGGTMPKGSAALSIQNRTKIYNYIIGFN